MHRLIGADRTPLENPDYDIKTFGMQYQWGRKDPFPAVGLLKSEDKAYYDGDGHRFDFRLYQKGDRTNYGYENAFDAVGSTYTMRSSIEIPYSIISHQSFWQLELFPFGSVSYFKDKYVFRYIWNRYKDEIDHINGPGQNDDKLEGGKTVFDPSPYGFRIMNYRESYIIQAGYNNNSLYLAKPGFIYDGAFNNSGSGGRNALYAISQAHKSTHAGYYYAITPPLAGSAVYRRACTFSVIPVEDSEKYGDPMKKDYTEYLPDYKASGTRRTTNP